MIALKATDPFHKSLGEWRKQAPDSGDVHFYLNNGDKTAIVRAHASVLCPRSNVLLDLWTRTSCACASEACASSLPDLHINLPDVSRETVEHLVTLTYTGMVGGLRECEFEELTQLAGVLGFSMNELEIEAVKRNDSTVEVEEDDPIDIMEDATDEPMEISEMEDNANTSYYKLFHTLIGQAIKQLQKA